MIYCDRSTTLSLIIASFFNLVVSKPLQAQAIPDSSLGNESSVVTIEDETKSLIEGGATRGNSLFHSLSEFNVEPGSAVYFANPAGITDILTRVTGSEISNILGTLGVEGAANLFLLNPNGIVFGENANLDIAGSFLATTAESYLVDTSRTKFSASEAGAAPLLSVNLAPGLQMGNQPGKITVQGQGHGLIGGVFFPLQNNDPRSRLQIGRGQTLSLIAGAIEIDGGTIAASGGNIELASVKQGNVSLDFEAAQRVNTEQVTEFGELKLTNKALLDTGGIFTGDITLQGQNITFEGASTAIIQNLGAEPAGTITVKAADLISLMGSVRNSPDISTPQGNITGVTASRITTESLGLGTGGDITLAGKNLLVEEGSSITSRGYSNADTGNLKLNFSELIDVNGFLALDTDIPSLLGTNIFGSGNSGTIDIAARNFNISNGATVASLNFASGQGGNINVNVAEELRLTGVSSINSNPSSLSSTVYRTGSSRNLTVNANKVYVLDGAKLSTATFASGNAGELTVNAAEYIRIEGTTSDQLFESSIASDGEILPLRLQQFLGLPNSPSGNSGNITLNTSHLILSDSGEVGVSNEGLGDSGSLTINSDRLTLDSQAKIAAFSASGQGGNIELQVADLVRLENRSAIIAEATANATSNSPNVDGGNIKIDTDLVALFDRSQINANAAEGNGGNIEIVTQGYFVSADSLVSASSKFGLDGSIEVDNINGNRQIELKALPTNPLNASEQITTGCSKEANTLAITGKGGLPENPRLSLRGRTVWQDLRVFSPNSPSQVQAANYPPQPELVEAQAWQINKSGVIELLASGSATLSRANNLVCR